MPQLLTTSLASQYDHSHASSPRLEVQRATAADRSRWDQYVSQHPEATLFHAFAWRDSIVEAFDHRTHYLIASQDEAIVGVLPLVVIASRLFGRRLVSVPYGVGGGVLADDDEIVSLLFGEARKIASEENAGSIDLRSSRALVPTIDTIDRYVGFERELPTDTEEVLDWLPRKARAAARNGRDKFGLEVSFGDEHLREVWELYAVNMRRLGSINYPFRFFERLIANTPEQHWVCIVKHQGQPVTGLVTFLFRDRVLPYFFGASDESRSCSAANFTYFSVMQRAVAVGYRIFDFGRSRRDNPGSYDFKRFHGFEPQPLGYQRWSANERQRVDVSPSNPMFQPVRRMWSLMPLAVTRPLGSYLSRHIPG